jgi:FeS assembly SUF system protein
MNKIDSKIIKKNDSNNDKLLISNDDLISALKTVYDPEIPVDIYELGLIYNVDVIKNNTVEIKMTLTAPGCPVAEEMPGWVENAIKTVDGVEDVIVEMVFDPPWDMSLMSEEARLTLNMY